MPGVIKINPDVMNDKRDALAVAWNEGLRILMEDIGFDPQFEITPEQESFFAGTAYAEGGGGVAAEKGTAGQEVPAQEQGLNDPRRVQSAESGGDVMVTVGRGEDPQKRLAQTKAIVAESQALVDKATPWFMRPGKVASRITLRRYQGTDPSGKPVYSEVRPVDQTVSAPPIYSEVRSVDKMVSAPPTAAGRLQNTLSTLTARASEVVPAVKEAAILMSEARQNIERAAGAARGAAMSKAIGEPVEYKMGTLAEAREAYKDIDLGFGKGRLRPEWVKKGDPGYAEALEFNNSVIRDLMK